jgi:hypothetical protein
MDDAISALADGMESCFSGDDMDVGGVGMECVSQYPRK